MFDDRIEIVSYGGLPYTLTKEGFFNGTSVPVNKGLLLVFIAAGYAEQSGHGVPTIVNKYGRDVFSFDDGMIKVTIPLAFDRNDVVARKNAIKQKNGLTKNQKTVYEIYRIKQHYRCKYKHIECLKRKNVICIIITHIPSPN